MRLLVVEDEIKTGDYLQQGLTEAGFMVTLARNGLDGHHLAMTETFDLLVLDVMLPDVDGWRIVQSLREAGRQTPVLFLTARDSVDDRVKGLELGLMITWSSPSLLPSCWPGCALCCVVVLCR